MVMSKGTISDKQTSVKKTIKGKVSRANRLSDYIGEIITAPLVKQVQLFGAVALGQTHSRVVLKLQIGLPSVRTDSSMGSPIGCFLIIRSSI